MAREVITNSEALEALRQITNGQDVQTIFAIPHFNPHVHDVDGKGKIEIRYLDECLKSLESQIDLQGNPETRFAVVVVNDASPAYRIPADATPGEVANVKELISLYERTIEKYVDRIKIIAIEQDVNGGIGNARNPVIDMADKLGIQSVSFLDHDDTADQGRVAATIAAFDDPNVDLVYSAFDPMDKDGKRNEERKEDNKEPLPLEVGIEKYLALISNPLARQEGAHKWRDLFLEHDYYNLPSTTSVRTSLMAKHPFTRPLCEDNSIWPVLMAYGGELKFLETRAGYRVLPKGETASRAANGDFFDVAYVSADLEGLDGAVRAAQSRGLLTKEDRDIIFSVFMERSIAYNDHKPNGKHRPDIAATLRDLCEGRLSFDDALDIQKFLERVNFNAKQMRIEIAKELQEASGLTIGNSTKQEWDQLRELIKDKYHELGITKTLLPDRIKTELDREKAGEPITYKLVGGTGLQFDVTVSSEGLRPGPSRLEFSAELGIERSLGLPPKPIFNN